MKFVKVLEGRRSIRKFEDKAVSHGDLKQLIKAALLAPSWKNSQTGRYYVVSDPDMLNSMRESCLPPGNAAKAANAAALIVTTFVKDISGHTEGKPDNECGNGWGYYDLGLASENLCLQAYALGLGTLIMGIRNEAAIRKLLEVPQEEIIVSVIAVGWPAVDPDMPKHRKVKDSAKFF